MTSLCCRYRAAARRGQSLTEFALVLPVLLVVVLFALDFGRAFFSWVTITNASRIGANYAAMYPRDTYSMTPATNPYVSQVTSDGANALSGVCPLRSGTDFLPVFIDGPDSNVTTRDLGDSARVTISCTFRPLTPIVGGIVGTSFTITASSTFPIRTGFTR